MTNIFGKTGLYLGLMFGLTLVACGGGGGSSSGGNGTISFSLTDAPGDYESVFVTITGVRVNQDADEGNAGSGFVDLNLDSPLKVDLLELQNGNFTSLGDLSVPTGTYRQLRLVLAETTASTAPFENEIILKNDPNRQRIKLTTPSAQQSGLKVNISETVAEGEVVDLRIDFDANKSVVQRGNSGQYNLKPVLRAVPVLASEVKGRIDAATLGTNTTVSLQQSGSVVTTTVPAADTGEFRFAPVEPGAYTLVIASENKKTLVLTGLDVQEEEIVDLTTDNQTFVLSDDGNSATQDSANLSGAVQNDDNPEGLDTTLTLSQVVSGVTQPVIITSLPLQLIDGDSNPATDDASDYSVDLSTLEVLVAEYVDSGSFAFQTDASVAGQYQATVVADYPEPQEDEQLVRAVDLSAGSQVHDFSF